MSRFKTPLVVEELADDAWRLNSDLIYESSVDSLGTIRVPKGFVTDFASVPRLPLAYLVAGNIAHEAAVVHDWLYRNNLSTKSEADRVFLEAMRDTGVCAWRRGLMYLAVSACGWVPWLQNHRRMDTNIS